MEEQKEKKKRFELVEVPTQYGMAFKDNVDESILDTNQILLKIANELEEIRKGLIGWQYKLFFNEEVKEQQ